MADRSIDESGETDPRVEVPTVVGQRPEFLSEHSLRVAFAHTDFGKAVVVFDLDSDWHIRQVSGDAFQWFVQDLAGFAVTVCSD
jgi:hypothetical protein